MPKASSGINLDVQMGSLAAYTGAMQGVADAIESDINVRRIAKGVQQRLVRKFDTELCATALATPYQMTQQGAFKSPYDHLFEPGMLGVNNKTAKLWVHLSQGVGRERVSSFVFRDSLVPLPTPTTRNTGLPKEAVAKLNKGKKYVFQKRAMIEEAGLETVLRPNPDYVPPAKKLVVPGTNARGYYFTEVFTYKRNRSPMKGTFVGFWTMWWAGRAPMVYESEIMPNLSQKLYRATVRAGQKAAKTRTTTKNFAVLADTSRAAAELQVQAEMTGWEKYVVGGDELNIFE